MSNVTIKHLHVRRGANFTLQIPHLQLSAGKVLCIIGPNGSGKTTCIETLAGIVAPNAGSVSIGGRRVGPNLRAHKAMLGFIPDDENWFVQHLSAREYLQLLSSIYQEAGVKTDMPARVSILARALHFSAFDQLLDQLSHGNKKKVQLIAALMHQPKVIIVDELRNGLDPLSIIAAEDTLKAEAQRGASIIAATHDLWWAQRFADRIMLLEDGNVRVSESTRVLVGEYGSLEKMFRTTLGGAYAATL